MRFAHSLFARRLAEIPMPHTMDEVCPHSAQLSSAQDSIAEDQCSDLQKEAANAFLPIKVVLAFNLESRSRYKGTLRASIRPIKPSTQQANRSDQIVKIFLDVFSKYI